MDVHHLRRDDHPARLGLRGSPVPLGTLAERASELDVLLRGRLFRLRECSAGDGSRCFHDAGAAAAERETFVRACRAQRLIEPVAVDTFRAP